MGPRPLFGLSESTALLLAPAKHVDAPPSLRARRRTMKLDVEPRRAGLGVMEEPRDRASDKELPIALP